MTEAEVITVMKHFLEGKFPKECAVCGRVYLNLRDYLLHTRHVGRPQSYDADVGDFRPLRPLGTMSVANCSCGNSLVIDSRGMELGTMWRLMAWLVAQMTKRGKPASEVLEKLRCDIDRVTLSETYESTAALKSS